MRARSPHILTILAAALILTASSPASAQLFQRRDRSAAETQIQYLSGTGKDNRVDWEFYCTDGRNSEVWTTIPVPSCWETEGFGTFNYGRDLRKDGLFFDRADEQGLYKHTFSVPENWEGRRVDIVFEGVMTDTEVKINGQLAGPTHQGGFYRFRYDVSELVNYGEENLLEVTVSKMSSDGTVNEAERAGDYWIFGGIYRPVYLESLPAEHIRHVAIKAEADGTFELHAELTNIDRANRLRVSIARWNAADTDPLAEIESSLKPDQSKAVLQAALANVATWSAESPALHVATVELLRGNRVLHTVTERFGFRTVEVRLGEGVFINGKRVMFKGSNRHVFWPDTARTVSRAVDELDVKLFKDMNMNAVRTSHYPPDRSFIETCDEQGLYVLEELAGWHWAYSDETGEPLVKSMVERDVNSPSVIFWLNGNEGGTNMDLNDDFGAHDPQDRLVLVPGEQRTWVHNGIITKHYPKYFELRNQLEDPAAVLKDKYSRFPERLEEMNLPDGGAGSITMPTEMLHGLYDGGHGGGLADFWDLMRQHKTSAGGFTWAYADEAIRRPDRHGAIDPHMTDAPDGIVGPYREKEGSFYAIKEIWTPVYIDMDALSEDFTGSVVVENRYDMTNLNQVRFEWELLNYTGPLDQTAEQHVAATGTAAAPPAEPGASATVQLRLPSDWRANHALRLRAIDWTDREVMSWTWPIKSAAEWVEEFVSTEGPEEVTYRKATFDEAEDDIEYHILECASLLLLFDPETGQLANVYHERQGRGKVRRVDFGNGPVMAGVEHGTLDAINHYADGDSHVLEVGYTGGALKTVKWKLHRSGWVELSYDYTAEGQVDYLGVSFGFDERHVYSVRWLGKGPYRVWKNRPEGMPFGLWEKAHNTAMTGHAPWHYPEFRGYHGDVFWAMIWASRSRINILDPRGDMSLRLYTPDYLPGEMVQAAFPAGDISIMDAIPPIGQKFDPAYWPETDFTRRYGSDDTKPGDGIFGPASARPVAIGDYSRTLFLFFGVE